MSVFALQLINVDKKFSPFQRDAISNTIQENHQIKIAQTIQFSIKNQIQNNIRLFLCFILIFHPFVFDQRNLIKENGKYFTNYKLYILFRMRFIFISFSIQSDLNIKLAN